MATARRYLLIPRAVVVHGRHLLLVRSSPGIRAPSSGRWHLPGGEVLEGESPQKAVERLIRLRSRLEIEVRGCLDAVARRGADPVTGRQSPLLHLFFQCVPVPGTPADLLPSPATSVAGIEHVSPPGGPDWGWTDLSSGLAALKHDLTGPAVIEYLQARLAQGPPG